MNIPTHHIYSNRFEYTPSYKTDLAAKFEAIRRQQEKKVVSKVRKIK